MTQDYVASFRAKKGTDLLQYGVKGMHWGVRKSRSGALNSTPAGGTAAVKNGRGPTGTGKLSASNHSTHTQAQAEIKKLDESVVRYNKLKEEVAKSGAHHLSNEDLNFLNARADAIARANRAFHDPEGWLKKNVEQTVKSVGTQLLRDSTQALVKKYVVSALKAKVIG